MLLFAVQCMRCLFHTIGYALVDIGDRDGTNFDYLNKDNIHFN